MERDDDDLVLTDPSRGQLRALLLDGMTSGARTEMDEAYVDRLRGRIHEASGAPRATGGRGVRRPSRGDTGSAR